MMNQAEHQLLELEYTYLYKEKYVVLLFKIIKLEVTEILQTAHNQCKRAAESLRGVLGHFRIENWGENFEKIKLKVFIARQLVGQVV